MSLLRKGVDVDRFIDILRDGAQAYPLNKRGIRKVHILVSRLHLPSLTITLTAGFQVIFMKCLLYNFSHSIGHLFDLSANNLSSHT